MMQVAAVAHLTRNTELLDCCRTRFKTVLVSGQIEKDGSLPQELRRTKPYGYSLFNLEAFSTIAQILSTPNDNLWMFQTDDGRGLATAMKYMVPYIRDKRSFPKLSDVMYAEQWEQSAFCRLALREPDYVELWRHLPADSTVDEVIRNFFVRQPVLWVKSNGSKSKAN